MFWKSPFCLFFLCTLVVLCTVVLCCNGAVRDLDVAEDHEDDCASHTYADLMMQGRRGSDDIFGRRRSSSKEMNADCTFCPTFPPPPFFA
jgi:hypothetical protein